MILLFVIVLTQFRTNHLTRISFNYTNHSERRPYPDVKMVWMPCFHTYNGIGNCLIASSNWILYSITPGLVTLRSNSVTTQGRRVFGNWNYQKVYVFKIIKCIIAYLPVNKCFAVNSSGSRDIQGEEPTCPERQKYPTPGMHRTYSVPVDIRNE